MATYDPIEAMAEFPGGGLGGGPEWQVETAWNFAAKQRVVFKHILVLYAGHSMSFIPGFFTTKSWLVVACCCSSQFSQWKSFSEAESCKLQVLVPIQRGHQVWSRSFMQPLHTHDHPRVHCWISNKHRHSEWTVCIQRWPATLSRHVHLFLWRISTICQPRQCRSNSNQETKIEHLLFTLFTCHSVVNAMFLVLFLLEIELQSLEVMGEKGILRVASAQTIQRPPRNGIQNPICSGL